MIRCILRILVLVLDSEMALVNAIAEIVLDAILVLVPRKIHNFQRKIDLAEPTRWPWTNHRYLVDVAFVPLIVPRGAVDVAFAWSSSFPNLRLRLQLRPYHYHYPCAWRMAIAHASTNEGYVTMTIAWRNRIERWYVVVRLLVDADDPYSG